MQFLPTCGTITHGLADQKILMQQRTLQGLTYNQALNRARL